MKLSDSMSCVNVVNMGETVETQDKCRGRDATETNSAHQRRKINRRTSKSALDILRSLHIRANYNENIIGTGGYGLK